MSNTVSGPEWTGDHPPALVIACSDGRFQAAHRAFVEDHLGLVGADHLVVPGGGGALVPSGAEFSRAHRILEEARFLVRAHDLHAVVVLFHAPAPDGPDAAMCGDYQRKFPDRSVRQLLRQQDDDAREVLRLNFGTGVTVGVYRSEITAERGCRFVRLGTDEQEVIVADLGGRTRPAGVETPASHEPAQQEMTDVEPLGVATLGGGCFWCLEAVFERLAGVERVVSGYAGGDIPSPSYELVCSGTTGHAEVVRVHFDPGTIGYREILEVFFSMHDPTTLNRQGPDIGTQYRSIVLAHSPEQRETAETLIAELDAAEIWRHPVVTEVADLEAFYPAESHHQNYYRRNPEQQYCQVMIDPKVAKLREKWAARLKPQEA